MQRRRRQSDADRLPDREPTLIVHQILVRSDPDCIAVKASGIRGLDDPSAQYQAAVRGLIGWTKPRLLAAEVSHGRGAERDLRSAAGCNARSVDNDAAIERALGDDDPRSSQLKVSGTILAAPIKPATKGEFGRL